VNRRVAILLFACAPLLFAGAETRFSFATRILPILTKAGCNTGECHGAAIGAGGFRLSLLGYDPHADYLHITRERNARRVDLTAPEKSLVLRKPAKQVAHEGGRVFKTTSNAYRELHDWIAAGASEGDKELIVETIDVTPSELRLAAPGDSAQLTVTATLSDGSRENVTQRALYDSDDDGLAQVDEFGEIRVQRRGVTSIMIRYGGRVTAIRAGVPFQANDIQIDLPPHNFIDARVAEQLQRWRIPASPLSEPAVFFRRAHLDLTGRLPEPTAIEAFLRKPDTRANRDAVVADLLQREALTDLWTLKLADLLLISPKKQGPAGSRVYHQWLREQVAVNAPVDRIVHSLLTASGDLTKNAPANFHKLASDPRDMGEYVSRALLGMRVACARCHNHPFDRWTMSDYHEFAAFFADTVVENNRVITKNRGEVRHPKDQRVAHPRPLGGRFVTVKPDTNRRDALAAWLTAPENPWFARAFVNRVWKELLGRGIIDPVDDVRVTNPPTNPGLLDALTADFVNHGFDLRHLVGTIARSATYQLSSRPVDGNRSDDRLFSHARLKPLTGQTLADAITAVTGVPEQFTDFPDLRWTTRLPDVTAASRTLDVFGRCPRTDGCDAEDGFGGGLPQALHLINSDPINTRLRQGSMSELIESMPDNQAAIRFVYLRTLGRPPSSREATHWKSRANVIHDRTGYFEDLAWALMNSREFTFNH